MKIYIVNSDQDPLGDKSLQKLRSKLPDTAADPGNSEVIEELEIKIHGTEIVDAPIQDIPYQRPVEIIVGSRAWSDMIRHASEDLRHEAGGVMLGEVYHYDEHHIVRINNSIVARETVNSMTSIQFTYQTWRQMEEERQNNEQIEKLVGWYHTHPGFTAFFSETDRFMHENFFPQPWHVALVIDPINGEHKFFRWDGKGVKECDHFLLQIEQGPGPKPPLSLVLADALRESTRMVEAQHKDKDHSAFAATLRKLTQSLPRVPSSSPLDDILPLLIACAGLEAGEIDEMRRQFQEGQAIDQKLQYRDMDHVSKNHNSEGPITINQNLLAQLKSPKELYVRGFDTRRPFRRWIGVPDGADDVAIDELGNLLLLKRDDEKPLLLMRPTVGEIGDGNFNLHLEHVEIDWQSEDPPETIAKIAASRQHVYLLSKSRIHTLRSSDAGPPRRLSCLGVYPADGFEIDGFTDLTDWTTDLDGNLYILIADSKKAWRFDQVQRAWQNIVDMEDMENPVALCASFHCLSILDDVPEKKKILQYSIPDGRPLGKYRLGGYLREYRIRHLFSDGYQRLYLVFDDFILSTR